MKLLLATIFISSFMHSYSQLEYPLYKNKIPNSKLARNAQSDTMYDNGIQIISKTSRPTLTAYLPEEGKANGKAVIICPGGGYSILAATHEGADVARKFNEMGITAFVLKYRMPSDEWMIQKEIGPLQDAQRAIQMVRENASQWKLNSKSIGIMGFSAGGHLASTAATHFSKSYIPNKKRSACAPTFLYSCTR